MTKIMKRIRFFVLLILGTAFFSCQNDKQDTAVKENQNKIDSSLSIGGTLIIGELEMPRSICPGLIEDVHSMHVSSQIFEGLVAYDPKDLSIKPLLAEKWEISEDGLIYTFHLRKGVRFHDDNCFAEGTGREVKAQDVLYSFKRIANSQLGDYAYNSTIKGIIKGADEYFQMSLKEDVSNKEISGIKVLDDYTIQFELTHPSKNFLNILANTNLGIVAKEAVETYGNDNKIGTGPFKYASLKGNNVVLVKNEKYWAKDKEGNALPYLDSLVFRIVENKRGELEDFKNGKIDIIFSVPAENVKEFIESDIKKFEEKPPKFVINRVPALASQYYEFNLTKDIFKKKEVRQALNYAIDRNKIIEEVLKGAAYGPAIHGFIPTVPQFKDLDLTSLKGYTYDPDKAKKLLAKAGYPDGKGFPTLKLVLNSGAAKNTSVATEVQSQLYNNLGIMIELELVSFDKKIEISKYGKSDMVRSAWAADFPAPESFLLVFYGKNISPDLTKPAYPNSMRYVNSEFDKIYEQILAETDDAKRKEIILKAEQMVIEDAPILYLWYDEILSIHNGKVFNFHINPINHLSFREVYKK